MDYITADEKAGLTAELKERIGRRKELSDRIGRARELGDLKENGEYHAAREDQGLNEAKIKQLEERLASAIVADSADVPEGVVFLGATVTLRNVDNDAREMYRLVGESSGRFDMEYIEVTSTSPMGLALMKARKGEVVRVNTRRGEKHYEIVEVEM
ncbi:MAG: transcription elongation factor GreA [Phycisphaerales bacterium]|nr:transcription elongation factor GreA [Phycisphaerales bacterium]